MAPPTHTAEEGTLTVRAREARPVADLAMAAGRDMAEDQGAREVQDTEADREAPKVRDMVEVRGGHHAVSMTIEPHVMRTRRS